MPGVYALRYHVLHVSSERLPLRAGAVGMRIWAPIVHDDLDAMVQWYNSRLVDTVLPMLAQWVPDGFTMRVKGCDVYSVPEMARVGYVSTPHLPVVDGVASSGGYDDTSSEVAWEYRFDTVVGVSRPYYWPHPIGFGVRTGLGVWAADPLVAASFAQTWDELCNMYLVGTVVRGVVFRARRVLVASLFSTHNSRRV